IGILLESRENFRQAVDLEMNRRLNDAREQPDGLPVESVAPEAAQENRVVVGPDGAEMISHRVEAPGSGGEAAYPPSAKEIVPHQSLHGEIGPAGLSHPAPEGMPRIGAHLAEERSVAV